MRWIHETPAPLKTLEPKASSVEALFSMLGWLGINLFLWDRPFCSLQIAWSHRICWIPSGIPADVDIRCSGAIVARRPGHKYGSSVYWEQISSNANCVGGFDPLLAVFGSIKSRISISTTRFKRHNPLFLFVTVLLPQARCMMKQSRVDFQGVGCWLVPVEALGSARPPVVT